MCVDGENPQYQGVGKELCRLLQPAAKEEIWKEGKDDAIPQTILSPQKS